MTSNTSPFFGKTRRRTIRRRAVSPVIATTIIIAITVTLGLALWAFANAGVGTAAETYSDAVISYGDFTKDRFVIANVDFDNPSANRMAFWIFNSGKQETDLCLYDPDDPTGCQITPDITVVCRDCIAPVEQPTDLCQADPAIPSDCLTRTMPDGNVVNDFRVPSNELRKFSFDITSIESGSTYEITVFSDTGASQMFLKKES